MAKTGQPGTLEPDSVQGGENKQDRAALLVDMFNSDGALAAARAVEAEQNDPERQKRLAEVADTEQKIVTILKSAEAFKLDQPKSKFVRGLEMVFNPYAKQQRQMAEQKIRQHMVDVALGALPQVIQERRLLEQPGPFETKLQEEIAKQFGEAQERARREDVVAKLDAAGVKIDPLERQSYVESGTVSNIKRPPTHVEELKDAADLGAMLEPDRAKQVDLGDKDLNDMLLFSAEAAAAEAKRKSAGKGDEPDFAPGYKTASDARKAVLDMADQIQKQGPQDLEVLGQEKTNTPYGQNTSDVTRPRPRITVEDSIRAASEKLGVQSMLPQMGLGIYAPGGAMNNPASDRKKIADKVREALEKRRAAAAAKSAAGKD